MLRKTDKFVKYRGFLLSLTNYLLAFSLLGQGVRTVVIDAGHGGKTPGAMALLYMRKKFA